MFEFYVLLGIGALLLAFVLTWLNDKVNDIENFNGNVVRRRKKGAQARREVPGAGSDMPDASGDAIDAVDAKARELLAAGNKIEAIKYIREQTGLDLKDAKDYVERL
jgi:ribosomal protein L7/L12